MHLFEDNRSYVAFDIAMLKSVFFCDSCMQLNLQVLLLTKPFLQ